MTTTIVLTVLDAEKRQYRGFFESDITFGPRLTQNGALTDYERGVMIELARHSRKSWFPADSRNYPPKCTPCWIVDVIWVQSDPHPGNYYRFDFFNAPLMIPPLWVASRVGTLRCPACCDVAAETNEWESAPKRCPGCGFPDPLLDRSLDHLTPLERLIELDKRRERDEALKRPFDDPLPW